MVTKEILDEVTWRLVKAYNPVAIYLFGSYAWGLPTEDSDIDLAIVVEVAAERRVERAREASIALRGLPISKDIIVYTREEFQKAVQHPSTLARKIQRKGRILYGDA